MKVMLFCDFENFKHSIIDRNNTKNYCEVNYEEFHNYLFKTIMEKNGFKVHNPQLIRTYVYTGQYTNAQIDKAKSHCKRLPKTQAKLEKEIIFLQKTKDNDKEINKLKRKIIPKERIEDLKLEIEKAQVNKEEQTKLFKDISKINFLELRTKPLKYMYKDLRFAQKGVDVQLAVDLVNSAHFNNYDVAILCSGDLDLLEPCKFVKSLGKTLVLVSHDNQVSPNMIKESDYYLNIAKISEADFTKISVLTKL